MAHPQLMSKFSSTSTHKSFLAGLLFIYLFPSLYWYWGSLWSTCGTLLLALLNPMRFPLLQLVQVPLDGILSFRQVNCATELGVVWKFSDAAFNPTVYAIDKNIKHYQTQHRCLRDSTCNWSLFEHWAVYHCTLDTTIQKIPYVPNSPSIKIFLPQFREKDVVGDCVRSPHRWHM